jgi:hypothetical protein
MYKSVCKHRPAQNIPGIVCCTLLLAEPNYIYTQPQTTGNVSAVHERLFNLPELYMNDLNHKSRKTKIIFLSVWRPVKQCFNFYWYCVPVRISPTTALTLRQSPKIPAYRLTVAHSDTARVDISNGCNFLKKASQGAYSYESVYLILTSKNHTVKYGT